MKRWRYRDIHREKYYIFNSCLFYVKKSKWVGDVQRTENLWTSSFYAQGRTDEVAADAVCAPHGGQEKKFLLFTYGEISMDVKDRPHTRIDTSITLYLK